MRLSLYALLLTLALFSCEREEFYLVQEEALPREVPIIEEGGLYFRHAAAEAATVSRLGKAKFSETDNSFVVMNSPEVVLNCPDFDNPMTNSAAFPVIYISGSFDSLQSLDIFGIMYIGDIDSTFGVYTLNCADDDPTLDIEFVGDTVRGSFSGQFADTWAFDSTVCDTIDIFEISGEFAVPLTRCQ